MHASSSTSSSDHRPVREAVEAPRKAWKFPVAALAAFVLVGGFEAVVWKYRYWTAWDANYILLEQKRKAMTEAPAPDTIAILGMSRFYHMDPEPIRELLGDGAKVTNYAWGWCGIEAYEAMLRGMIQADRVPKVILVDAIPEIFGYKPELVNARDNEGFKAGLAQTAPRLALLRTQIGLKEWEWVWETTAQTMTPPSTLFRRNILAQLENLARERKAPSLPPGFAAIVETWRQQGWFIFAPGKVATEEDFLAMEQATGPYTLYANDYAMHAYRRFVKLAHEHEVKVVLLPVPINPLVNRIYERDGVFEAYDRWLSKLEDKYPNFAAPHPRWVVWPDAMGDALHVNEQGKEQHMQIVLDTLQKLDLQER